jgi:hypothetical protein
MTLGNKYIYLNGESWLVKGVDYSQKVRRFNWNKLGGSDEALLEAQKWRDQEEQKKKDNAVGAIVEYNKVLEENKKLKEQQEADYKRLKEKEALELEKQIRIQKARERLYASKKQKEIQEDLDYFDECLTINTEQMRAKWASGVWDHLDPKGNRFAKDKGALTNWIEKYPTEATSPAGKQLIKDGCNHTSIPMVHRAYLNYKKQLEDKEKGISVKTIKELFKKDQIILSNNF